MPYLLIKKCKLCGAEFVVKNYHHEFCSRKCFRHFYESQKKDIETRLLCTTTINNIFNKEIYADAKFEFEYFDNTSENINFEIYLI